MPPGNPHHAQRKGLPTWAIVLMVIGGLIAAGFATCVVAGGAAIYWAKGQVEAATEAYDNGRMAGVAFGTGKSDKECAAEILRREPECDPDQLDFGCMQSWNGFAVGCWQSSGTPEGFCVSLEAMAEPTVLAERRQTLCPYFGIEDASQCGRLLSLSQAYCLLVQAEQIEHAEQVEPGQVKLASPAPARGGAQ